MRLSLQPQALEQPVDPATFRRAMGAFPTGVAIVTTAVDRKATV